MEDRGEGKARPGEGSSREGPRERVSEPNLGTCPETVTGTSEWAQVSCLLSPP